jgi:hypothetical protein
MPGTPLALSDVQERGNGQMQVIAVGKWSKTLKRFQTVVSIRRPSKDAPARRAAIRPAPRPNGGS